jgi:hypothetical protein
MSTISCLTLWRESSRLVAGRQTSSAAIQPSSQGWEVNSAGGLVATICHGPWILISAGIARGRRMTSTIGIRDDVVNAGATWVDEPVVVDGNVISSRVPRDLPAFGEAIVDWLGRAG